MNNMRSGFDEPLSFERGPAWSNRLALAPLTNTQSHADGTLSDDEYTWLTARADGGFGLTMTCAAYVAPAGQIWPGQLGVSSDAHLDGLGKLADSIRRAGSISAVQLHHGGRRATPEITGHDRVAPWADLDQNVRALTTVEVGEVIESFVEAAVRAERAGFDGVEVHGAHGYLVAQFLDARHNHRTDGYGSTPQGRSRMLFEVLEGIRACTAPDFQLGLRLSPEGQGIALADGLQVSERVMTSGLVDYLDVSLWDVYKRPRDDSDGSLLIDQFAALERGKTRLGVAGKIVRGADVRWCLERGVDFVDVGTAAILHHDFPQRMAADGSFISDPLPVTPERLRREHVGEAFVNYLADNWGSAFVEPKDEKVDLAS